MDERIFEAVAKKYGVSSDDLKRDIRTAIEAAYENPNPEANKVPRKGAIPTVDEIMEYASKKLRTKNADSTRRSRRI
ncbi:MAG: sporulation initiation factor Spo0A C-terminal domain-containing protein [Firmicutes bacterium]|nr:sporulation initiation factor Spo0A C-terminal domain-containing protein [Bacillota bacterium]